MPGELRLFHHVSAVGRVELGEGLLLGQVITEGPATRWDSDIAEWMHDLVAGNGPVVRALEALMDGFAAMTHTEAAAWGDLFVTATGNLNVFRREHFEAMRDGAIMANSGHFDAELDLPALQALAEGHVREVRENVQEFDLGGKKLHLIAEGRLVNLSAAEGHPASVMDMSFANQALSAEYVAAHHAELEPKVYVVPEAIDSEVARLKLAALGIELEPMTPEQAEYVASWQHGT